jgi:hypothetical protein
VAEVSGGWDARALATRRRGFRLLKGAGGERIREATALARLKLRYVVHDTAVAAAGAGRERGHACLAVRLDKLTEVSEEPE